MNEFPDDPMKVRRAKKVVDNGTGPFAVPLAQLTESIITNDKLDQLTDAIKSIEIPEYPEIDIPETKDVIFPEVQKVEVLNFPEQKAPVVNVKSPIVNVDAPIVEINNEEVVAELKNISDILSRPQENREDVDFQKLFDDLGEKISKIKGGGGFGGGASLLETASNTEGIAPLSGGSANGTRDLTSANTWYAVPSTVPSVPYTLVVTQENATGTIRWGFDNTGTPSATNGNQAPNELRVKLAASQVVYYASSTAGDDVNWTTKII